MWKCGYIICAKNYNQHASMIILKRIDLKLENLFNHFRTSQLPQAYPHMHWTIMLLVQCVWKIQLHSFVWKKQLDQASTWQFFKIVVRLLKLSSPSLQCLKLFKTLARLKMCSISIYELGMAKICIASNPTYGNLLSWFFHKARGHTSFGNTTSWQHKDN